MKSSLSLHLIALLVFASASAAQQGGWLIESTNIVSPSQPTTTIEVWAWFNDPQGSLAFAAGDFGIAAGDGLFSSAQVHLRSGNPGINPGVVNGSIVEGVRVGQVWGIAGWFPNPANPVLVWSADWTATDFTPHSVVLETRNTTSFFVGEISTGAVTQLYPQAFTPGTGVIRVVPTPASAAAMVVVGTMMLRRRR